MISEQTAVVPRNFRAEELKRRLAMLGAMALDAKRQLADLRASAAQERRDAAGFRLDSDLFKALQHSIDVRCDNLNETLATIERERISAQADLARAKGN